MYRTDATAPAQRAQTRPVPPPVPPRPSSSTWAPIRNLSAVNNAPAMLSPPRPADDDRSDSDSEFESGYTPEQMAAFDARFAEEELQNINAPQPVALPVGQGQGTSD
ncbi:hypothetical protein J7J08_11085 [Stenotrophomonas sp. ISL-67]|uniref:hypothetical protein n=1 Tax=Stenotrophomonas sp. ISL-67 TaxID=2819171 RepID=UPI001BEC40FC|nr:hypothetical protein [Stenotrophomonas sp. ISL-67]MBT2768182.1 hypothetical protein [Stenotrophomonas sp. ISL-67]